MPPIETYTLAEQAQAADELSRCEAPMLIRFMSDYGVLRDQLRAAGAMR